MKVNDQQLTHDTSPALEVRRLMDECLAARDRAVMEGRSVDASIFAAKYEGLSAALELFTEDCEDPER